MSMRNFFISLLGIHIALFRIVLLQSTKIKSQYIVSTGNTQDYRVIDKQWGTSKFANNYQYGIEFNFDESQSIKLDLPKQYIRFNDQMNISLLYESYGIKISYLKASFNNHTLIPGSDITIRQTINSNVSPKNYFNNLDYLPHKSDPSFPLMDCLYSNPGPNYIRGKLLNVSIDSIVNLRYKNLGIKRGEKGIKILSVEGPVLEYDSLDNYIRRLTHNNTFNLTSNITFTNLFVSYNISNYMESNFVVVGVDDVNNLHIYNVINNYQNFTISMLDYIPILQPVKKVITIEDKTLVSLKSNGFKVIRGGINNRSSFTLETFNKTDGQKIPLNVTDFLVVESTVYMIIFKFGLVTYDLSTLQFSKNYFEHPNMWELDHTTYLKNDYIGVVIDNNPPDIPEYFIEFVHNKNTPDIPLINRVFVSQTSYNISDIVTDNQLGLTYIFDHERNSMLIINRAVPNFLSSYNYIIDFSNYHKFHSDGNPLFLLALSDNLNPGLVIKDGNDYVIFRTFEPSINMLQCKYQNYGEYEFQFSSPHDCSRYDPITGKFNFASCLLEETVNIQVGNDFDDISSSIPEGDSAALWVVLGLIIIVASIVIISCVCCRFCKCCRKSTTTNSHYMRQGNNEGDVVEVQVMDNKL